MTKRVHTSRNISPEQEKIVKFYNARAKIFEHYGVEKQIKSAFGQTVSLKGGGYLIIEHTEALRDWREQRKQIESRRENQETTALSVNIEAAKEIARQLRLRDKVDYRSRFHRHESQDNKNWFTKSCAKKWMATRQNRPFFRFRNSDWCKLPANVFARR